MAENGLRLVLINCRDRKEAERIGRALIEERLAGAVNILDGVASIYRWRGEVVEAQESLLIAKTTREQAEALGARARALHGYACPSILTLVIEDAPEAYRAWLAGATRPSSDL